MLLSGLFLIVLPQAFAPAAPPDAEASKSEPGSAEKAPDFEKDVAPIFMAKCLKCHGEKERKSDLDLRTPAGVLKGGESGAVVVPKEPEKSLLYEKALEGEMPPGKKDRLSEAEVATIRRWIEAGARASAKAGTDNDAGNALEINQHDVIPILLRRCTVCHGAQQKEAGLDLRTKASMLRGENRARQSFPERPTRACSSRRSVRGKCPL